MEEKKNNSKNGHKTIYQAVGGSVSGIGILIYSLVAPIKSELNEVRREVQELRKEFSVSTVKIEDMNEAEINKLNDILDEVKYHTRNK